MQIHKTVGRIFRQRLLFHANFHYIVTTDLKLLEYLRAMTEGRSYAMLSSDCLPAVLQRFLFLLSLLRPKLTRCCERYTNRSSFDRLTVENPLFCDLTVMIISELHVSRADLKSTGRPNAVVTVIFRLNVPVSLLDLYSVRPPLDSFERFIRGAP